jgi:hypothetical protein
MQQRESRQTSTMLYRKPPSLLERMVPINRLSITSTNLLRSNNTKRAPPSKHDTTSTFYFLTRGGSQTTKSPTAVCKVVARRAEEKGSPRHVRFDQSRNETYLIPTIDELTDQEFLDIYYDAVDFKFFKGCCLTSVRSMKHGIPEDEDKNCYRGLESIGCPRKKLNRAKGAFQVLQEQDRQFENGSHRSPEKIRALYSLISSPCRHEALRRGLQDAKAVMLLSLDGGS